MSRRAPNGYRDSLAQQVERRLEVMPHAKERRHALLLDGHQQEAMLEAAIALQSECHNNAFSIVHSCGAGKTVLEANFIGASQDAKTALGINGDRKDMVLTTERALITSIQRQFSALGFDENDVGIWGNGQRTLDKRIIIATIQAIQMNRERLDELLPLDSIDLVVGDEADKFLTEPRSEAVQSLHPSLRIGLTATPEWPDGRNISDLWGPIIHQMRLREGISRGVNVPPLWFLYEADIDEDTFRIHRNDYDAKTVAAAMKQAEIHRAIPHIYRTIVPENQRHQFPTLIYVPDTFILGQVVETLDTEFGADGINVHGWTGESTPRSILSDEIQSFMRGEIDILVLCEMGGRGIDFPSARLLIDAYPGLSANKLEQRHGRVSRRVREGSPLYNSGFRKDFSVIVQIHPRSNQFRPLCLPDIIDGWDDVIEGRPIGGGTEGGRSWLVEVDELRRRIEEQEPDIGVRRVRSLDIYRRIRRREEGLPVEDDDGFIHLP